MHVKCERTVLKFILGLILKEDVAFLTRITTFLMRLIGMSDVVVQPQAVIDNTHSLVFKEHVCSSFNPSLPHRSGPLLVLDSHLGV